MLYAAPAITIYSCCIAALLGACMGSFLNCAAWRIVHGESVLRGRSHCDVCGHVLAPRDLVPVFSYVFSHGRCRYCGAKLSPRHAVGEAVAALVFVSLLLRYDISLRTLEAWAVACLLLACAFADLTGDYHRTEILEFIRTGGKGKDSITRDKIHRHINGRADAELIDIIQKVFVILKFSTEKIKNFTVFLQRIGFDDGDDFPF